MDDTVLSRLFLRTSQGCDTMLGVRVASSARSLSGVGGLYTSLACRCRHASAALVPGRPAVLPRRALSSLSEDNFSVCVQWDDWLATGLAMDDVAEQEEFLGEKKIIPQQYFLHAGSPEFSPFQPLQERLYRVAQGFEQEDDTMMTVHEGDVVELLEQADTGWWRMQVSAGEHHYEGWVPEDVIDHDTEPDEEESDIFAMGRIWHGDSSGALAFQEDTQVASSTVRLLHACVIVLPCMLYHCIIVPWRQGCCGVRRSSNFTGCAGARLAVPLLMPSGL